ncbi:MAG: hypothetical protein JRJ84_04970 [Deltaproteobacteria bacterium]|nr:hypothetical protein [Deltaproteobacteria bacterium]
MRAVISLGLGMGVLLSSGCGPNCQSTCQQIFDETQPNCGIRIPGRDSDESISDCISACEGALQYPGDVGDYNPFEPNVTGSSVNLDNEKQAAIWMECVEQTACEDIADGFCAPISF